MMGKILLVMNTSGLHRVCFCFMEHIYHLYLQDYNSHELIFVLLFLHSVCVSVYCTFSDLI